MSRLFRIKENDGWTIKHPSGKIIAKGLTEIEAKFLLNSTLVRRSK